MKNSISKQIKKVIKKITGTEKNILERIDSIQNVQNLILTQILQGQNGSNPNIIAPQFMGAGPVNDPGMPGSPPPPQVVTPEEASSEDPNFQYPENVQFIDPSNGSMNQNDLEYKEDEKPFLDVLMPVQEGRFIHLEVMRSLCNQNVKMRLWMSTLVSNGDTASARNQVKQYGQSDYILMTDNDLVLPDDAVERMTNFLDKQSDFGAVALSKKHIPDTALGEVEVLGHIDAGPVMWRKEVFDKITYQFRGSCECMASCEDIRALGYEIGFLTGTYAKHIVDTRSDLLKGDQ